MTQPAFAQGNICKLVSVANALETTGTGTVNGKLEGRKSAEELQTFQEIREFWKITDITVRAFQIKFDFGLRSFLADEGSARLCARVRQL